MNQHNYMELGTGLAVCVRSHRRPSLKTIPKRGTWIIREWNPVEKKWRVAGEVTWSTLQKLEYLGKTKP